jgi:GNAT superfamily N-acetyltransferase
MDLEGALRYLKLLADETRLRLLGLVAQRERSVGELAEILGLREPTISHHLSKLSAAGLVEVRPEGTLRMYRLNGEALQGISRELFAPERVVSFAGSADADAWERRVLGTFLEEGRLTKIPDTRKKRDVVLRWLATRFEEGRRYPEREVNRLIQRHHPDSATLRRELIGARLMRRENGIYWRPDLPFSVAGARLRVLDLSDEPIIQRLYERCSDYIRLVCGAPPQPTQGRDDLLDMPEGKEAADKLFVGAFSPAGELIAVLDLVRDYPAERQWYIGLLMIDPEQRGRGLGGRIYGAVEAWIRTQRGERVGLCVQEQNPAAFRFWSRLGFREVERTRLRLGALESTVAILRKELTPA